MEVIFYLLLIALVVYLIYLLVRYVILPIASVVGVITLVVSAGYGLIVSLISFIKSLSNNLSPYATYVDKHADISSGISRNYFFVPVFQ